MTNWTILVVFLVGSVSSIKIASYNTFQVPNNPYASLIVGPQVAQVGASDVDVLCLQELTFPHSIIGYKTALQQFGFTHSFSILDVRQNGVPTPQIPCDSEELSLFTSVCATTYCNAIFPVDGSLYVGCLATYCPEEYAKAQYDDCFGCFSVYLSVQPSLAQFGYTLDIAGASAFCANPPQQFASFLYNFTGGELIASRADYPIVDTWSFTLPSWLFVEKSLLIAEIDICKETDPTNPTCTDSIVVGCVHQEPTGYRDDESVVQVPDLVDDTVSSHIGLNRLQTESILDVYNDDILQILGISDNAENIFGVFLLGDLNSGQMWNRCEWSDADGDVLADNCDGEDPSNPFELYLQNGFVDGTHIAQKDAVCTACTATAKPDYNTVHDLFPDDGTWVLDMENGKDLDHLLIQEGYCKNFEHVEYSREFMDEIVDGWPGYSAKTPGSDHYGVSLDIVFKGDGGGRCEQGKCH
eukprot:93845_1